MTSIMGLHHAQISIPKGAEEAGRAFYCGVLGLPEIAKPLALQGRGGFWLQVGDRQVHVGTEDGVERAATKAHIAYAVDDIDAWRAHLALAHNALHFALDISFRDGLALVVEFFATAQPQFELGVPTFEVQFEGDERQTFGGYFVLQLLNLAPMQEQLTPA
jgi:catechol 2,3-dioxygenase-like lactoylglutathione lyase family enzyme